jgi:hypothetical protein
VTGRAHFLIFVITMLALFTILRLLRRGQLRVKYALLWLTVGVGLAILAAWPGLLDSVSHRLGIQYPPATFFLGAITFFFLVVLHFSWELSRLEERTRVLAEEIALANMRIDSLTESDRTPLTAEPSETT